MKDDPFAKDPAKVLAILSTIADTYDSDSEEHAAVEIAAKALVFAAHDSMQRRFQEFLKGCKKPGPPM